MNAFGNLFAFPGEGGHIQAHKDEPALFLMAFLHDVTQDGYIDGADFHVVGVGMHDVEHGENREQETGDREGGTAAEEDLQQQNDKGNGDRGIEPQHGPTVQTVTARRGDLQEEISVSGSVAGASTVNVYAPASGTIKEVYGRVGDEVSAGTLFVTYDMDKIEKELYQAKLQNERTQISYENTLDNNSKGNGKVKEAHRNEKDTHDTGYLVSR